MMQKEISSEYKEAQRYMDNAKESLKKAGKVNGYYLDKKYVRTACGTAYNAVLIALDEYLIRRNMPIIKKKHQRKNVDDYKAALAKLNKKLLNEFDGAYHVLHLNGYYEGVTYRKIIDVGMEAAANIITGCAANSF